MLRDSINLIFLTHKIGKEELKPTGEQFLRVDEADDWTIIDLGDAFIHLMSETSRNKYSLEEFLSDLKKSNKEG